MPLTSAGDMPQAIHDARIDLSRFDYVAAIRHATDGLIKSADLNRVQRERLLLLRAEAHHCQRSYERALADADEALQISDRQSPQAQFIRGRELFFLSRLEEARDAFELAEVLMESPAPAWYVRDAAVPEDERWANIGFHPGTSKVDERPPEVASAASSRAVTYEWANDLAAWRQVRRECLAALAVFQTRVVPRTVLSVCQTLIQRRLAAKSARSVVVLVRNDTTSKLVFDFHRFASGQFLDGCAFPHVVPPMSAAIAGVHANGWMRGVNGVAGFALGDDHLVCIVFDCPAIGAFAPRAGILPRSQLPKDGSAPSSSRLLTTAAVGGDQFRVTTATIGYVQTFSVARRNRVTLSRLDLLSVLDYLPAAALRKAAVATTALRALCLSLPPQRFHGLHKAFPDYRLASDVAINNWTVHDPHRVRWSIRSEARFADERTISFVDSADQKIFFLNCDVYARAVDTVLFYGSSRSPIATLEESFFATAKRTTFKIGGRTAGHATWKGNGAQVELQLDCFSKTAPYMRLDRHSETTYVIAKCAGENGNAMSASSAPEIARVLLMGRSSKRSGVMAEIQMFRTADALLVSLLAFVALFRA